MSPRVTLIITLLLVALKLARSANSSNPEPMPMRLEERAETCLSKDQRDIIVQHITTFVKNTLLQHLPVTLNCGLGTWYQVASLNMSDPGEKCPPTWRQFNSNGVKACGRPATSNGSCPATFYPTNRQYSRVCGRAIGYQVGGTHAFGNMTVPQLDSNYVHGVSITHGAPHNHIWTYAAGVSEGKYRPQSGNCPCSNLTHPGNAFPPSFIRDNYYCESGNIDGNFSWNKLYSRDPLWDGQQCEGHCCSDGKSPPWFSVELPNPTTDDIEVRICDGEDNRDETLLQLLELYIQ